MDRKNRIYANIYVKLGNLNMKIAQQWTRQIFLPLLTQLWTINVHRCTYLQVINWLVINVSHNLFSQQSCKDMICINLHGEHYGYQTSQFLLHKNRFAHKFVTFWLVNRFIWTNFGWTSTTMNTITTRVVLSCYGLLVGVWKKLLHIKALVKMWIYIVF